MKNPKQSESLKKESIVEEVSRCVVAFPQQRGGLGVPHKGLKKLLHSPV